MSVRVQRDACALLLRLPFSVFSTEVPSCRPSLLGPFSSFSSMSTDPPGYGKGGRVAQPDVTQAWLAPDGSSAVRARTGGAGVEAYEAQAMNIATAQGMSLFQTGFFLWMMGNQLTLWTLFFLVTMGTGPMRNIMNVHHCACALRGVTARPFVCPLTPSFPFPQLLRPWPSPARTFLPPRRCLWPSTSWAAVSCSTKCAPWASCPSPLLIGCRSCRCATPQNSPAPRQTYDWGGCGCSNNLAATWGGIGGLSAVLC